MLSELTLKIASNQTVQTRTSAKPTSDMLVAAFILKVENASLSVGRNFEIKTLRGLKLSMSSEKELSVVIKATLSVDRSGYIIEFPAGTLEISGIVANMALDPVALVGTMTHTRNIADFTVSTEKNPIGDTLTKDLDTRAMALCV